MRTNVRRLVLAVLLAALAVAAGCSGESGDTVVARIGHVTITDRQLTARINELPLYTRQQFSTPEGRIEFLERMVEEEVLYQAAVNAGYESHPEVVRPLEAMKRRAVVQIFYREEIEKGVEVSEDDIVAYYEEYGERFQAPARVRFRHIMTATREQAEQARRRALAGEAFANVAREVSTDGPTKEAGGLTNSVTLGRGLPRLGMDETFIERLFAWKVGEITDVLRSDNGWHVLRIEELREAGPKPLDEVRADIVQTLQPDATRRHFESVYGELKERLNASINEDAVRPKFRSEEELFTLAQNTEDAIERLGLYKELQFSYPEGKHAAEAQFMVAFIYAEELKSYEAAAFEFQKMLDTYPDSELCDSAEWMLENMEGEDPQFEDLQ
ncbi:MAG: peptidyl-prolyl cis-trans isomerase [Candidatus Eisenbacteria bacterium]